MGHLMGRLRMVEQRSDIARATEPTHDLHALIADCERLDARAHATRCTVECDPHCHLCASSLSVGRDPVAHFMHAMLHISVKSLFLCGRSVYNTKRQRLCYAGLRLTPTPRA